MGLLKPKRRGRSYIIHSETRNLSFLQTSNDLKKLGIKNNMFFLRLYDEDLRFVDPHDPMVARNRDLVMKIVRECIINPWYFLRECARIPDQGGNGIAYQLHRANLAATWCF